MNRKEMKTALKCLAGIMFVGGFLLMCSETLPGEEGNGWWMALQELTGLGVIAGAFKIAEKIEG